MEMNYCLLTSLCKNKAKIFFLLIYLIPLSGFANDKNNKSNKVLSGYLFAEPSTRSIQDDDFLNPGVLWVEHGEKLKGRSK